MKIEKTIWIKIIIIAVIAVLSATVVAQKAGSPDSRLSKACIQQLDKQRGNSEALAASAVGLSVAIGLLPGDVGSGIGWGWAIEEYRLELRRCFRRREPWPYSGDVEHPDRLMLNTLTGEIEQAFR